MSEQSEDEDIEELQDDIEEEPKNYDITTYPDDMRLETYQKQWERNYFKIPDFQRNYVWDIKRASKLIESFLLGLPVPPVFLYKHRSEEKLHIIDGFQRIQSVVSFLQEKIEGKRFELSGVRKCWNGKTFSGLSEAEQEKLRQKIMRAMIISQHNPDDHTSIYQIFERLNTGGIPLNTMQVRMCIADGNFTKLLKNINKEPLWRNLLNLPEEDKKIKDIEYLLRICAFTENADNYKSPMKRFLTDYIESKKKISDSEIKIKKDYVMNILNKVSKLNELPFHLHNTKNNRKIINPSLMDSVVYALSKIPQDKTFSPENYKALINDENFLEILQSKNTSDRTVVKERLRLAKEILEK